MFLILTEYLIVKNYFLMCDNSIVLKRKKSPYLLEIYTDVFMDAIRCLRTALK